MTYAYTKVNKLKNSRMTSISRFSGVIMHADCVYSIPKISLNKDDEVKFVSYYPSVYSHGYN